MNKGERITLQQMQLGRTNIFLQHFSAVQHLFYGQTSLILILLSIFISRLLIKIVAGADTGYFPNCIVAGTLAFIGNFTQLTLLRNRKTLNLFSTPFG